MKRFCLTALIVFVVGCSSGEYSEFADGSKVTYKAEQGAAETPQESGGDDQAALNEHRHVVYVADIDLEVNSFADFRKCLPQLVEKCGGYISNVTIDQYQSRNAKDSVRSGEWKLKIKSTSFEKFVSELSTVGLVTRHHQTAEDMTVDYVDLNARIVNKKRMESRVLELINESKRSLSEVVSLEKELSRIRGEIERMEGRLNLIRNRTEYATLTLTATEHAVQVAAVVPFGKRVAGAWNQSTKLLESVLSSMAVVAIYMLPWLVVFTVFVLPLILLIRWYRLRMHAARHRLGET